MLNQVDEAPHSELPPSSADKWFHCHAWLRTTRPLPRTSSPAAEEGTRAHRYFEEHLRGERNLALIEEPEMFDYLSSCADWVESQVEELQGALYVEERLDFGERFGYVGLTGTADVLVVSPDTILLGDLKYGAGPVEVEENLQMLTYLVGAVHQYGPRSRYQLAILQPRAAHPNGRIRTWALSHDRLEAFASELERAIAGNYGGGPAKVGGHCRKYCPALGCCPAVAEHVIRLYRSTAVS
jgi:hypothetical protein